MKKVWHASMCVCVCVRARVFVPARVPLRVFEGGEFTQPTEAKGFLLLFPPVGWTFVGLTSQRSVALRSVTD